MGNVSAEAIGTITWLDGHNAIAVPVYQRRYRWSESSCARLLDDILAVASEESDATHFLGSMLVVADRGTGEITLVDGQQRLTTLMLLMAALRDLVDDDAVVAHIRALLRGPEGTGSPRLKARDEDAAALANILMDTPRVVGEDAFSRNYELFLTLAAEVASEVWAGTQRLETVMVALGDHSNPQQVFESLNSTGEALTTFELIHNYIHIGLQRDQQQTVERTVWLPIEDAVGSHMDRFWRDFLIVTATTEPDLTGDHGVYRQFRDRYPRSGPTLTETNSATWLAYAESYRRMLRPEKESSVEVARELRWLRENFLPASPFVLAVYHRFRQGAVSEPEICDVLRRLQTMFLRRQLLGLSRDLRFVWRLCRTLGDSPKIEATLAGLIAKTPMDAQVDLALRHSSVPLAGYVLERLQQVSPTAGLNLQIEHIYPQTPKETWTGNGETLWSSLSPDDQARYRMLVSTLGNLTLLEAHLNQGASNRPYRSKAEKYYSQSRIAAVKDLSKHYPDWSLEVIEARTAELTQKFLKQWPRPTGIDEEVIDERLTRVVDLPRIPRQGYLRNEFEYVLWQSEMWGDARDIPTLYRRVFERLWADHPEQLLDWTAARNPERGWSLIADASERKPHQRWFPLTRGKILFAGYASQWLLAIVQEAAEQFGLADALLVELPEPTEQAATDAEEYPESPQGT